MWPLFSGSFVRRRDNHGQSIPLFCFFSLTFLVMISCFIIVKEQEHILVLLWKDHTDLMHSDSAFHDCMSSHHTSSQTLSFTIKIKILLGWTSWSSRLSYCWYLIWALLQDPTALLLIQFSANEPEKNSRQYSMYLGFCHAYWSAEWSSQLQALSWHSPSKIGYLGILSLSLN